MRVWSSVLLLALSWAGAHLPEDSQSRLKALSSSSLAERVSAERWLAEKLTTDDYPLIAGFVAEADAEARTRLTQALGVNDAHIELAALLAADDAPNARRVGDGALRQMAQRWSGDARLEPLGGEALWEELRGRFEGLFAFDAQAGDVDELAERLARAAPRFIDEGGRTKRVALTVDPTLFEALARARAEAPQGLERSPRWIEGPFDVLLRELARPGRTYVDLFGRKGDAPWLWLHGSPNDGELDGADLLRSWCRNFVLGRERTRGEAAARALAQSGWPAPLPWLTRLWLERADTNALAGVLVAAGRGRIAAGLLNAAALDGLLAEFERREREERSSRWERFRREFAAALAHFPPTGTDGDALSTRVARWAEHPQASRARIECAHRVLTGMRQAPPSWRERVDAQLRAGGAIDEVLWALESAAALASGPCEPRTLPLSLEHFTVWLERRIDAAALEWCELVCATGPSDESARAQARVATAPVRALWIDTLLAGAAPLEPAAKFVRDWIDDESALEPLGERLAQRTQRSESARVAKLLDLARAGTSGRSAERARRLSLLAGVMPALERQRWFELLRQQDAVNAEDWPLLGAFGRWGSSPPYAEFVLERALLALTADAALDSPWVAAFAQAYAGAAGRGELELAERLRRELWVAVRRARHPLAERMDREEWPPPPGPAPSVLSLAR